MGSNATIAGTVVGAGALIGAGAVVTADVPDNAIVTSVARRVLGNSRRAGGANEVASDGSIPGKGE